MTMTQFTKLVTFSLLLGGLFMTGCRASVDVGDPKRSSIPAEMVDQALV